MVPATEKEFPMKPKTTTDPGTSKNQGEGNREAGRRYNEAQHRFVASGKVAQAAGAAAPDNAAEAAELQRAEQAGRSHAKGEVPTVPGANATAKAKAKHAPRR
ncbi:MAG: hypothetical protein ABIP61_03980, partial [Burkholderiaceae bacterium]